MHDAMLSLMLLLAVLSPASASIDTPPIWSDLSAAGAARFCHRIAQGFVSENPGYQVERLLAPDANLDMARLREEISDSGQRLRTIEILVSIGSETLLRRAWPEIEKVTQEMPEKDWGWDLPAIAVMCSNGENASYLFERGFDPNQHRKNVSNFMMTAIVQRDVEMVRTLFAHGYRECDPHLPKDASLPALAERLDFPEYTPLHESYCGASSDSE